MYCMILTFSLDSPVRQIDEPCPASYDEHRLEVGLTLTGIFWVDGPLEACERSDTRPESPVFGLGSVIIVAKYAFRLV